MPERRAAMPKHHDACIESNVDAIIGG